MESRKRILDDALVFAGEAFLNQFFKFWHVKVEHTRDETECINVLTLILGRTTNGFNRQARNWNAHVVIFLLPFGLWLDMVGIVKSDAALLERGDVVFVGMLIESEEHVGFIPGAQNFA